MLIYKISRYEGGPSIYRQDDEYLLDVIERFIDVQEEGNTLFIEVVDMEYGEWRDDPNF